MSEENAELKSDQQQNLALLKVYTFYRVALCIALLATFFLLEENRLIGELKPDQFLYSASGYLLINIIALITIFPKRILFTSQQLFSNFVFDIIAILLITDASNGAGSGLGILLVVIVAAGSIMLRGQLAALLAAIASIAIIADTALLLSSGAVDVGGFLPAGLLGLTFFITAFLIQNLAGRIRKVQNLAAQRAVDVARLQSLNQQIVQRMRTGIIVADEQGYIRLSNAAASELLGSAAASHDSSNQPLTTLPKQLLEKFNQWQAAPQYKTLPFLSQETGREINANFSALSKSEGRDTLIFLEDNKRLSQRAQQMKLASLGRLTASIAHEIRNPLSAISHAAQLLEESEALDAADKKLSDIIQNHSKRMNRVIENVLDLSRRQAPRPEKINLNNWLAQLIADLKYHNHYATELLITVIDHNQVHEVIFDPSQLTQVINNIAQNGLRYSMQNTGTPSLTFNLHHDNETGLSLLDIIDDGQGISDDQQQHLFEPFYTTETKGTGLGLYISRELCDANESRLDYLYTPDKRSCFRISFPHSDRRLLQE